MSQERIDQIFVRIQIQEYIKGFVNAERSGIFHIFADNSANKCFGRDLCSLSASG